MIKELLADTSQIVYVQQQILDKLCFNQKKNKIKNK